MFDLRKYIPFIILIFSFLIGSCLDNSRRLPSEFDGSSPFNFQLSSKGIRIINLSPNCPELDFIYASKTMLSKGLFKSASASEDVGTMSRTLLIRESTSKKTIKELSIAPKSGKLHSIILWDKVEFKQTSIIESYPQQVTNKSKVKIRFFLGTKDISPKIDIKVNNKENNYFIEALAPGEMTDYYEIESGRNDIIVYPNQSNSIALTAIAYLDSAKVYSVYLGGFNTTDEKQKLGMYFLTETNYQAQNLYTYNEGKSTFRYVQAFISSNNLDLLIDNTLKYSSIPFKRATNTSQLKSGTRNFKLVNSGTSTVRFDGSFNINFDKTYLAVLIGNSSKVELLVNETTKQAPSSDRSFLRLINCASNNGAINFVFVSNDNKKYYQTLTYKSVSNYINFPAGGVEIIAINPTQKDTLKSGYVYLEGGKSFTGFICPISLTTSGFTLDFLDDSNDSSQDLFGNF